MGSGYNTDTIWSVYATIQCKVVECTEEGEGACLPFGGDREFQTEGIIKSMAVGGMRELQVVTVN